MGKMINPLKRKAGEPIKPMSLKEILGEKKDMMSELGGEKEEKEKERKNNE